MENDIVLAAFSKHLRVLREQKRLSQQQLADEADIAKRTLQKIEKGSLNPSLLIMIAIAEALEISLQTLIDFEYKSGKKIE